MRNNNNNNNNNNKNNNNDNNNNNNNLIKCIISVCVCVCVCQREHCAYIHNTQTVDITCASNSDWDISSRKWDVHRTI